MMPAHHFIRTFSWFFAGLAFIACSLEPRFYSEGEDGGLSTDGASDGDADADADSTLVFTCENQDVIDDMEDGDGEICSSSARIGSWVAGNDKTAGGIQEPAPDAAFVMSRIEPSRGDNRYAIHTYGSGFTSWGTVIYAKVYGGTLLQPFDASAYTGIAFSAKSADENTIKVKVRTVDTLPEEEGGTCTENCYNSYARADIPISADWSEYEITFAEMKQEEWGPTVDFKKQDVMGVEFFVPPENDTNYDLWIDNLRFF